MDKKLIFFGVLVFLVVVSVGLAEEEIPPPSGGSASEGGGGGEVNYDDKEIPPPNRPSASASYGSIPITEIKLTYKGETFNEKWMSFRFKFKDDYYALNLITAKDEKYARFFLYTLDKDNLESINGHKLDDYFNMSVGETKKINLNGDKFYDISIQINDIVAKQMECCGGNKHRTRMYANFTIKKIKDKKDKEDVTKIKVINNEDLPEIIGNSTLFLGEGDSTLGSGSGGNEEEQESGDEGESESGEAVQIPISEDSDAPVSKVVIREPAVKDEEKSEEYKPLILRVVEFFVSLFG